MQKKRICLLILCIMIIGCSTTKVTIQRSVNEKVIADLDRNFFTESLVVSPDVRKIAFVEEIGLGMRVVVNDIAYKNFHNIGINTPIFSPTSEYVEYFAYHEGYSRGALGLLAEEPYWKVVRDSVTHGHYSGGLLDNSLVISPDGKNVAYGINNEGNGYAVVFDYIPMRKRFSGPLLTNEIYIWDVFPPFVFSPNSKSFAYVGEDYIGVKKHLILDNKAGKGYLEIYEGTPVFSPDSKKIAYAAQDTFFATMVVNDQERGQYDEIAGETVVFSPDSKHLAFAAKVKGAWYLFHDWIKGKQYDGIGTIVFSPNSEMVAYTAMENGDWVIVRDNKEIASYEEIGLNTLLFSPDGKQLVFTAKKGEGFVVVVNGKESRTFEAIGIPVFSPNSEHIAFTVLKGDVQHVVINGIQGKGYPAILSHNGGKIVFDNNHQLHYLAITNESKVYLVTETF